MFERFANLDIKTEVRRINGYLKEITTLIDSKGNTLSSVITPIMTELKPRDILQVCLGVLLFGVPLCYTEEVWTLSKDLKLINLHFLNAFSFLFVSIFVYFNFYRFRMKGNISHFLFRILFTYIAPFLIISLFLLVIERLPFQNDFLIAYKRVSLIAFPSMISGAISDLIK